MNLCKICKSLAWMFFGLVMAQALYTGVKFGCWLGFAAGLTGFIGGIVYGRFKKRECSIS
jgi:membrane associated rhomboid family serine protease